MPGLFLLAGFLFALPGAFSGRYDGFSLLAVLCVIAALLAFNRRTHRA